MEAQSGSGTIDRDDLEIAVAGAWSVPLPGLKTERDRVSRDGHTVFPLEDGEHLRAVETPVKYVSAFPPCRARRMEKVHLRLKSIR